MPVTLIPRLQDTTVAGAGKNVQAVVAIDTEAGTAVSLPIWQGREHGQQNERSQRIQVRNSAYPYCYKYQSIRAASLAAWLAVSLPGTPTCAGIHRI